MNTQIELLKQKISKIPDSGNERSFYPALCNFFEEYGKAALKIRAPQAVSEESLSKDDKNIGFPDITIRSGQALIGWVEVKLPGDEIGSDKFKLQFGKYKDSLEKSYLPIYGNGNFGSGLKMRGRIKLSRAR